MPANHNNISAITIVTGASRGLGAAFVGQLLQPGHALLGISRGDNPALQARADAAGAALTQWRADLADPQPVAGRLAAWLAGFDGTRVASVTLINNAGVVGLPATLDRVPAATLALTMRAGLEAPLLLTAAFLAATGHWTGQRRVLNISSGLGRRAMAGSAAYCAAKAGMDHFSRAVTLEQASLPNGARIVSMAPGVIDTDMQAELRGADAAVFPERERFAAFQAQGLLVSADDCARALLARLARADFGSEPVADIREG
ncbi:MAG TPA: SDR family NAD(P)-dependent oxidoreductase [Aquabacterium sp.]|nr:SDR family NAD(P)-dependent oxidoreductase [Aquabacterium sp.]